MKSDEPCVLLQWVFNFLIICPFANFTWTPLKHPLHTSYSFPSLVTYNFELMGWWCHLPAQAVEEGRAFPKGYRLCSSTGTLEPEVPLLSVARSGCPLRTPRLTLSLEFACPSVWLPFLVHLLFPPQICLCCPSSSVGRNEALPGWPGLD